MRLEPGDRIYIPVGGLRLRIGPDGSTTSEIRAAVDPWLPNEEFTVGIDLGQLRALEGRGFPVRAIYSNEPTPACWKSNAVRDVLNRADVQRLGHLLVAENKSAVGVLDLDKARGTDLRCNPTVGDLCEALTTKNTIDIDAPLMDYLLSADSYPFRVVVQSGKNAGFVDVSHLQKLPVRVLLFMHFIHLEILLMRVLSDEDPALSKQVGTIEARGFGRFGEFGGGPERLVERWGLRDLLNRAAKLGICDDDVTEHLVRFRNLVAHGPRWYVTRRREVSCLVRVIEHVRQLIGTLSGPGGKDSHE